MATNNVINLGRYSFSAYLNTTASAVTGDGTLYSVICDTAEFNEGSCYNVMTGIYTAPIDGNYCFIFNCFLSSIGAQTTGQILFQRKPNTDQLFAAYLNPSTVASAGYMGLNSNILIHLSATDTMEFLVALTGSTKTVDVLGSAAAQYTRCSGFLVL